MHRFTSRFFTCAAAAFLTAPGSTLPAQTTLYWPGSAGTWNASTSAWSQTPDGAAPLQAWSNTGPNSAVFGLTAATVTVASPVTVGNITFNTTGYTLSSSTLTLSSTSTITVAAANATIGSVLAGSGANLIKAGTGTLTLSGSNTYSGGTTINAGILQISNNNQLGNTSGGLTFGGGTLATTAAITSARTVTLNSGGGTINVSPTFTTTLSGNISGVGGLSKDGTGTLSLTGTNTYSGGTTVSAGTLRVTTSSLPGSVVDNATLEFNQSTNGTYAGAISGTGNVTKLGTGTVVLSGTNSYTGTTAASAGTLRIAGPASLYNGNTANWTSSKISITSGVVLSFSAGGAGEFTATDLDALRTGGVGNTTGTWFAIDTSSVSSFTYGSNLGDYTGGGAFNLLKTGTGTLVLSGANTYTGNTTISTGTLSVSANNNLGSTTNKLILNGGTLATTTGISSNRAVTLSTGTTSAVDVAPGQTTTFGGVISGSGNLTKTGSGILTLAAANTFSGTLSVNAGTLSVSNTNQLPVGFTLGGGTLRTTTGLTITQNVVFDPGASAIEVPSGQTTAFSGAFTGTGSLVKTDGGNLTLPISNFLTAMTFNGGTATASGNTALGDAAGTLYFGGGNLSITSTINPTVSLVLNSGGGGLDITSGQTVTFSRPVTGVGNLTKTGTGTLTLVGANTYTGGTTITAGTLRFPSVTSLPGINSGAWSPGNFVVASGDTAQFNVGGSSDFTSANLTTIAGGSFASGSTLALDTGNSTGTFSYSGNLSGSYSLGKVGNGTVALSGANTYTGTTTVGNGTLLFANPAALYNSNTSNWNSTKLSISSGAVAGFSVGGSGEFTSANLDTLRAGNVALNSGAGFGIDTTNSSGDFTYTTNLADYAGGTFGLAKLGSGTLVLTGTNTYTGGTLVSGGTLRGTTASLPGSIVDNATVEFNQATDGTYSGTLSGTGNLLKTGVGNLTLSAVSTHSGTTTVSAGTLILGSATALQNSAFDTNSAGVLSIGSLTSITLGGLAGSANFALFNSTPATLNLTLNASRDVTFSGSITGAGNITKTGTARQILSGTNTYTGNTTISAGTLQFSSPAALYNGDTAQWTSAKFKVNSGGTAAFNIGGASDFTSSAIQSLLAVVAASQPFQSGSSIGFDTSDATGTVTLGFTLGNSTNGGLGLAKYGTGTLALSGLSTNVGATVINGGTLAIGTGASLGNASTSASTLTLGSTTSSTLSISGGGVVKSTSGTLGGNGTLATVLVDGAGSLWTMSAGNNSLSIVSGASAAITISNGGNITLAGPTHALAPSPGQTLNLTVQGAGSVLNAGGNFSIAGNGTNTVTIQNGGRLSATSTTFGGNITTSGSTTTSVTIQGNNTVTTPAASTANLSASSLRFGGNGTVTALITGNATVFTTSGISLGNGGTGGIRQTDVTITGVGTSVKGSSAFAMDGGTNTLNITDGAVFTYATIGTIGSAADSISTINVGGNNATLNTGTSALVLGNTGTGILNLSAGGIVNTGFNLRIGQPSSTSGNTHGVVNQTGGNMNIGNYLDIISSTAEYHLLGGTLSVANAGSIDGIVAPPTAAAGYLFELGGGTLQVGTGNSLLNVAADMTLKAGTTSNLTAASGKTMNVNSIVSGSGNLNLTGVGNVAITTASTYTGNVTATGGTLSISTFSDGGTASGLGAGLSAASNLVLDGATLRYAGNTAQSSDRLFTFSASGAALNASGNNTNNATLNLTNTGNLVASGTGDRTLTLTGTNTGNNTLSAVIANPSSGTTSVTKTGTGTWTLSGASTYTGVTTVTAGILKLGGSSAIRSGNALAVSSGATFNANGFTPTFSSITGAGTVNLGGGGLNLVPSGSTTFDSVYAGTGTLAINAAGGTAIFTGSSGSFGGTTSVSGGTVLVNGTMGGTAFSLTSGATLGGSGSISAPTTLGSGAHLSPGNSPGTLTFSGGLTLSANSYFDFQLGANNAGSDHILVTSGSLAGLTSGAVTLNLSDAGGFQVGTYTLLDYTGASATNFGAEDFVFGTTIPGYSYSLSLVGSSLVLTAATAIPEPSTYAALAGALALFIAVRRRRAQRS